MCIIAVKPSGKPMFTEEGIRQMFSRNRDGAGLMWTENDTVYIKKGLMTVEAVLNFLNSRKWDDIPVVLHFRIGTAGPNNELNCHPYPIKRKNDFLEGTCDLAMAHNGVMHQYNPPISSKINDTQVFVNTVVSKLPDNFLENEAICKLIENDVDPSRLCFLDKKGTITRFGKWIEEDGYFYSNDSFRIPKPQKTFAYAIDDCWKNYTSKDYENSKLFDFSNDRDRTSVDLNFSHKLDNNFVICCDKDDESDYEPLTFSFSDRFQDDVLFFDSINDMTKCLEELESKCDCIDANIYSDDVYIYEISPVEGLVYRWGNQSD